MTVIVVEAVTVEAEVAMVDIVEVEAVTPGIIITAAPRVTHMSAGAVPRIGAGTGAQAGPPGDGPGAGRGRSVAS